MTGSLIRAWEVCRALDAIDEADRKRNIARATSTTAETREIQGRTSRGWITGERDAATSELLMCPRHLQEAPCPKCPEVA